MCSGVSSASNAQGQPWYIRTLKTLGPAKTSRDPRRLGTYVLEYT